MRSVIYDAALTNNFIESGIPMFKQLTQVISMPISQHQIFENFLPDFYFHFPQTSLASL